MGRFNRIVRNRASGLRRCDERLFVLELEALGV